MATKVQTDPQGREIKRLREQVVDLGHALTDLTEDHRTQWAVIEVLSSIVAGRCEADGRPVPGAIQGPAQRVHGDAVRGAAALAQRRGAPLGYPAPRRHGLHAVPEVTR